MRYQERIYTQTQDSAIRNRNFVNFNMSSDVCIFEPPLYNMSGATKLDCTGATSGTSYIITANTQTLPLIFNFTGNTSTFIDTSAIFNFKLFKYSNIFSGFTTTPTYRSSNIIYSTFSGTNITTQYVPSSGLTLDGEYLVKGFFQYSACTDFLSRLGVGIDTSNYLNGNEYGIYNDELDYYFIAIKPASTPTLINSSAIPNETSGLYQQIILPPAGETNVVITDSRNGSFILSLNGLVLSNGLDYTVNGNIITLSGETVADDIITLIYTTNSGPTLTYDNIEITPPIISGATNSEGSNTVYFNTTNNKYELYTSVKPLNASNILIMLNGVTLANGIDFYQSISNDKRIILEGDLMLGDIITIVYFPLLNFSNNINTNNIAVTWSIDTPPQLVNGTFTLEVSTGNTFSNFFYTGTTDYLLDTSFYALDFIASGSVGTKLYYRVKNDKKYITICGNTVESIVYSDTIPLTISTNSINSY